MLCPPMHYIEIPLTGVFVHSTNIPEYMSANGVSFVGLLFALIAARMFYSPSYKYHILGAVFFKIRDFLDSVDGEVFQKILENIFSTFYFSKTQKDRYGTFLMSELTRKTNDQHFNFTERHFKMYYLSLTNRSLLYHVVNRRLKSRTQILPDIFSTASATVSPSSLSSLGSDFRCSEKAQRPEDTKRGEKQKIYQLNKIQLVVDLTVSCQSRYL